MLHARLPGSVLLLEPEPGNPSVADELPTKANVLTYVPSCTIAHFACHGYTNPVDPSQSLLLLHDYQRDPLNVAALASVALDHAELAYLSACSTAFTADIKLLDESIHLASAFQLAGFPHVIGTLWEINDRIAVTLADTFYTALHAEDDTLHTSRSAHALHHAVRNVRDKFPTTPSLWAAHIHVGT